MIAGGVLWLMICRLPVLQDMVEVRALIACAIIASYSWLTAYEFWGGRNEQLVSRWPAILMLFGQGALFLLRRPLISLLPKSVAASSDVFNSVWLTVLSFEGLLFTISVAFILLAMAKERTELRHRTGRDARSVDRHLQSLRVPAGCGRAVRAAIAAAPSLSPCC